jgi:hypothetical protein
MAISSEMALMRAGLTCERALFANDEREARAPAAAAVVRKLRLFMKWLCTDYKLEAYMDEGTTQLDNITRTAAFRLESKRCEAPPEKRAAG